MQKRQQKWISQERIHRLQPCRFLLAAVLLTGFVSSGCGAQDSAQKPNVQREDLIAQSLVSTGNTHRISRVFEKAAAGEDITIAYVGGSITEGYAVGARAPECYASLSAAEFETAYCSGGTVTCQNDGFAAAPSIIGNLQAADTVLPSEPDIILIEYAVNDGQNEIYQAAYESLVRTCLEAPNEPAVILLFTWMETGHTCQDQQQAIGEYYDLGMISLRDAIASEIESGAMKWSEYGADNVHPSASGHRLLADMLANYFASAKAKKPEKDYALPADSLHENLYLNAKICDASNTLYRDGSWEAGSHSNVFRAGFVYQKDQGNEPLVMDLTGRSLFIIYKKYSDPDWGLAGIYVNGSLAGVVSANQPGRWGEPAVDLIETYDSVQDLHVEIRMLDDQTDKSFEILALGVSE